MFHLAYSEPDKQQLNDKCHVTAVDSLNRRFYGINLSMLTGRGNTYEEALADYKKKFTAYMEKLKEFEHQLMTSDPDELYPFKVNEIGNTNFEHNRHNIYVDQAHNDKRITAITGIQPDPEESKMKETVSTMDSEFCCEMTNCKHHLGYNKCGKDCIRAMHVNSFGKQHAICLDKTIKES